MKKTLSIFLCLIIVVSLFGCNVQNEDNLDNKGSNTATNEVLNNTSNSTEKTSNEIYNEPFPDKKVIDIHSLEELNKMREMLLCEDEEQLKEYLSSFGNATTNIKPTKEDLEMLILKSRYQEANQSVDFKKAERFRDVIDEYYSFINDYPQSKHRKEADNIFAIAKKYVKE